MATHILEKTPVLSQYTRKTLEIYDNIYNIVENRKEKTDEQINEEALDAMIKYDIVTVESAEKLIKQNKVNVTDNYVVSKK